MYTAKPTFIRVKEAILRTQNIYAAAKGMIAETLKTPDIFLIAVYAYDVSDPIALSYSNEEERDKDFELIVSSLLNEEE
jgi:hypothetical protein